MRLPQYGCAGSLLTGTNLAPGIGRNSTPSEAQPILLEEKSGAPAASRGAGWSAARAANTQAPAMTVASTTFFTAANLCIHYLRQKSGASDCGIGHSSSWK